MSAWPSAVTFHIAPLGCLSDKMESSFSDKAGIFAKRPFVFCFAASQGGELSECYYGFEVNHFVD